MRALLSFAPLPLLAALALFAVGACDGGAEPEGASSSSGAPPVESGSSSGPPPPAHPWTECRASDQAFVRRAILALTGRRPLGQAEVNAYEDVLAGIRGASGDGSAGGGAGAPEGLESGKKLVALSLMKEGAFLERWSDFLMDALHIARMEVKSQEGCYGAVSSTGVDDGALAAFVRDNGAEATSPPVVGFTMGQLLRSAIELDDLSVVYRAHLFAMVAHPIEGANVAAAELERSRRQDFGAIFDAVYIHRDVVCLGCHNSQFSVTYSDDPLKNRAWPVPGLFEEAIYGASDGRHPGEEAAKGDDELRAHSPLRVAGVLGGVKRPFGWSVQCGSFSLPGEDDPLAIDAYFGSIRSSADDPRKGLRASVWDLEHALRRGVDRLGEHGLTRLGGNQLADPDEAFAYLVAENIVDEVWAEVMGTRLTIANYFPRTEVGRDTLMALTERFILSHFSLKSLLLDILAHPAFNLKAPEEGCGDVPYEVPPLFDPWTMGDSDPDKRGNSPGDSVFAISSRALLRSLHRAMEWKSAPDYPHTAVEEAFQTAIGLFTKDATPGYRGMDFQGRLSFEARYGACARLAPLREEGDFIDKLCSRATSTEGATIGDAIIALKDRLTGEPWIEPLEEGPLLTALVGAPLSSTDLSALNGELRAVCGVLVSSPAFMLGGLVPKDTRDVPVLTPEEASYEATCKALAESLAETYAIDCDGGVTVEKR